MDEQEQRKVAIKQLKAKRDFKMHLGTYVIINAMMIAIWAMGDRTGFWPMWVMIPWGVGLAFHGWNTYFNKPISEAEIERQMRR